MYNLKHISVGDVMRRVSQEPTELGVQLRLSLREGKLTPDRTTIEIIKEELFHSIQQQQQQQPQQKQEESSSITGFLIDGFPRTVEQAIMFEKEICYPSMIVFLSASEEVMKNRLLRRSSSQQQHGGRSDDTPECIDERLEINRKICFSVAERYRASFKNFLTIQADETKESVLSQVNCSLGRYIKKWNDLHSFGSCNPLK